MCLVSVESELNLNNCLYVDLLNISKSDSDANIGLRSLRLDANFRLSQKCKYIINQIKTNTYVLLL